MFACNRYGYQPDIITCAKGLTSGYAPLGAAIVSDRLAEPFVDSDETFQHGITYSGHPIGCAVGLANIEILEREDLPGRVLQHEGRLPERTRDALRPEVRRGHPRRGLLLRHRARQGLRYAGTLHGGGAQSPARRNPLTADLRARPHLPNRRQGRARHSTCSSVDCGPRRVPRDRAHPAPGHHESPGDHGLGARNEKRLVRRRGSSGHNAAMTQPGSGAPRRSLVTNPRRPSAAERHALWHGPGRSASSRNTARRAASDLPLALYAKASARLTSGISGVWRNARSSQSTARAGRRVRR